MIRRLSDVELQVEEEFMTGARMTADEFLAIIDEGHNYELIDGVVAMTPSPAPKHQHVAGEIYYQLRQFLESQVVGEAFIETDVHLGEGPAGGDLVYRPEVVFYREERMIGWEDKLVGAPDLVVEVISRGSRRFDSKTKKDDYERLGVHEYWLIDPSTNAITVFRHNEGAFTEIAINEDYFPSEAVPGFVLDISRVRRAFRRRR